MFPGFFRPKANFFKLPNDWFDVWASIRRKTGRKRILAPLKIVEYVIKWTWGYQNYDEPVRITWRDFQYGKRNGNRRLDSGTKLSSRSLEKALRLVEKLGLVKKEQKGGDDGPSFLPRLRSLEKDPAGFLQEDVELEDVAHPGFELPEANYFLVPAIWTDLTRGITSEILILSVEYFFRHTWGWKGGWNEPCWMTAEEAAHGRQYRSRERQEERYDRGIGYSVDRVQDGLNAAVDRGWLVWRRKGRQREYALHLKGMVVSEAGEFLHPQTKQKEEVTPPKNQDITEPAPGQSESANGMEVEIARLQAQVAALIQKMGGLMDLLHSAGFDVGTAFNDESKAQKGQKYSAYYTDTDPDTLQTPPPDTVVAEDGGGGNSINQAWLDRLMTLDPPVSREAASDLISTYEISSIRAWLEVLERDPTVRSVAALLIHKLRTGETPPDNDHNRQPDADCPLCYGAGSIRPDVPETDPDYDQMFQCPRCNVESQQTRSTGDER